RGRRHVRAPDGGGRGGRRGPRLELLPRARPRPRPRALRLLQEDRYAGGGRTAAPGAGSGTLASTSIRFSRRAAMRVPMRALVLGTLLGGAAASPARAQLGEPAGSSLGDRLEAAAEMLREHRDSSGV